MKYHSKLSLRPIIQMNHPSFYIKKLILSPDEKFFISEDHAKIKFWDTKTRKLIKTIEDNFSMLHDIDVSPNGKILAGGCENIKFWDVETGKLIDFIGADYDWIQNVAFMPDGGHLAVVTLRMSDFNDDCMIYDNNNEIPDFVRLEVWNINKKQKIWSKIIPAEPSFIQCTKNGWLVYNENNVITLLNLKNIDDIKFFKSHTEAVSNIAFSPDGILCASCSIDRIIHIWNLETTTPLFTIDEIDKEIYSLIFCQDGELLLIGTEGEIVVWHLKKKKTIKRLQSPFEKDTPKDSPPPIQSLAYSALNNILIAASKGIEVWAVTNFNLIDVLEPYDISIKSVTFTNNTKNLAFNIDNKIMFWDLNKNKFTKEIILDSEIHSIRSTSDGKILGLTKESNKCNIYTLYPKKESKIFEHSNILYSVAIDCNNDMLIAGSQEEIVFFDFKQQVKTRFATSDFIIDYLSLSPDGELLSFISLKSIINIMDIKKRKIVKKIGNPGETVYATFFSPDSKLLAFFGEDNTINLFDIENDEIIAELKEKDSYEIMHLAFTPDGKFIASAGYNKDITLWNIKEKRIVKKFIGHNNHVYFLSFSPDGRFLVSLSDDYTARLWNVESGNLIATFIGFADAFFVITGDKKISGIGDVKKYVHFIDRSNNIYDFNCKKIS